MTINGLKEIRRITDCKSKITQQENIQIIAGGITSLALLATVIAGIRSAFSNNKSTIEDEDDEVEEVEEVEETEKEKQDKINKNIDERDREYLKLLPQAELEREVRERENAASSKSNKFTPDSQYAKRAQQRVENAKNL